MTSPTPCLALWLLHGRSWVLRWRWQAGAPECSLCWIQYSESHVARRFLCSQQLFRMTGRSPTQAYGPTNFPEPGERVPSLLFSDRDRERCVGGARTGLRLRCGFAGDGRARCPCVPGLDPRGRLVQVVLPLRHASAPHVVDGQTVLATLHDVSVPPCKGGPQGTTSAGRNPWQGPDCAQRFEDGSVTVCVDEGLGGLPGLLPRGLGSAKM
ncbi:unnamed protein product [Rangifer tarandus platyrhynchus]|uniref:Uncharacterized protein n=1 Tax=Rangifer tarandus platyrhynchus TaxID=3082113 RepID=A0ABN8YLT8_RANTA|nr:unnamed protein product [Rangifer tarandus platyrhynchus]